jgi:hypothetical protein
VFLSAYSNPEDPLEHAYSLPQQSSAMIADKGDEVQLTRFLISLPAPRHEARHDGLRRRGIAGAQVKKDQQSKLRLQFGNPAIGAKSPPWTENPGTDGTFSGFLPSTSEAGGTGGGTEIPTLEPAPQSSHFILEPSP